VAKLEYLGIKVTNQNFINEIKSRLNSGNACCHSVRNLFSLLHIQNHNYTFCFDGCETLFLTLREEHRSGEFENRVLRRIFGPKREEVAGGWRRL
jgi:hypothetical protein